MKTCIVVADAARARFFARDGDKLEERESLLHAEGRMHEGDLVTDKGADVHESTAPSARSGHTAERARKHEAEVFAKQVAERVHHERVGGQLDHLIVVASPGFLGLLRDKLDKPTSKLLAHTVDKDLSKARPEEIEAAVAGLE
ncbi:MAG: host attachment protein [Spirochaetaceae bacterium]|nr:MAG: host attachment protein [Spirochaetaceae bacterium]